MGESARRSIDGGQKQRCLSNVDDYTSVSQILSRQGLLTVMFRTRGHNRQISSSQSVFFTVHDSLGRAADEYQVLIDGVSFLACTLFSLYERNIRRID